MGANGDAGDRPPQLTWFVHQSEIAATSDTGIYQFGRGLSGALAPELPRYKQMIQAVHERLGWNPDRFCGFRFRMRYPPIPTLAVLRHDLPERPADCP